MSAYFSFDGNTAIYYTSCLFTIFFIRYHILMVRRYVAWEKKVVSFRIVLINTTIQSSVLQAICLFFIF